MQGRRPQWVQGCCDMEPARQLSRRSGSRTRAAQGSHNDQLLGGNNSSAGGQASSDDELQRREAPAAARAAAGQSSRIQFRQQRGQQASQSPRQLAPQSWTHRKSVTTMPRRVSRWRGLTENTCGAGSPQFRVAGHCNDQSATRCTSWMGAAAELALAVAGAPAGPGMC